MGEDQLPRPIDIDYATPVASREAEGGGGTHLAVHLLTAVSVAFVLGGLGAVLATRNEGGAALMACGGLFLGARFSLWMDEKRRP